MCCPTRFRSTPKPCESIMSPWHPRTSTSKVLLTIAASWRRKSSLQRRRLGPRGMGLMYCSSTAICAIRLSASCRRYSRPGCSRSAWRRQPGRCSALDRARTEFHSDWRPYSRSRFQIELLHSMRMAVLPVMRASSRPRRPRFSSESDRPRCAGAADYADAILMVSVGHQRKRVPERIEIYGIEIQSNGVVLSGRCGTPCGYATGSLQSSRKIFEIRDVRSARHARAENRMTITV